MQPELQRLIDLLGDEDADVRLRSALELGEGRHTVGAEPLVDRFGLERDFQVREVLTWAVLRMREVALPLVRSTLGDWRWLARLQAAHTISKVGARQDGPRLLPLVADPVDVVAARAYWAVAQCGDPVAIPALVAELSRGSAEHRNSLLVALSHFGSAAVPALIGAVRDGATPEVRVHAADTLAYLGSPEADPAAGALARAVGDPSEAVRLAALNALGQLEVSRAWDVIERMAASGDPRLRLLATRLLERRPTDRALADGSARIRARADVERAVVAAEGPRATPRTWPAPDPGLVTCEGGPLATALAPMLALQVAVGRPQYLSREDVPAALLEEVRASARQDALARGRSDEMAARIAAGAVEQYIHEHVFLEQVSVYDPGRIVKDLLFGTEVTITDFVRLEPLGPP